MVHCKNCDFEYAGKYCPECGQKAKTKRITNKTVWEEVRHSLVHYDRGFMYTAIQLFRRPGHAIRAYIEGQRSAHIKPVKFMLWTTAINFLIFHWLHLDELMLHNMSERTGQKNIAQLKFTQYIFDHPSLVLFFLIPNIALFSWLLFRRTGYNYAEHFVINAYLMGEVNLFGVVTNPLYKLLGGSAETMYWNSTLVFVLWLAYMGWAYRQLFAPRRQWTAWVKAVGALLLGYVLLIVLLSVVMATIIALFGAWLKPYFQGLT